LLLWTVAFILAELTIVTAAPLQAGAGRRGDDNFEDSNCRSSSTLDPSRRRWLSVHDGAIHSLQLDDCLDQQRFAILRMVTGINIDGKNSRATRFRDEGSIEFFRLDERDKISRCFYSVKKDQSISENMAKYVNHEITFVGMDRDEAFKLYDALIAEIKNLVAIICPMS
jgi:hypothetical protein